jgi:hypothetical protein
VCTDYAKFYRKIVVSKGSFGGGFPAIILDPYDTEKRTVVEVKNSAGKNSIRLNGSDHSIRLYDHTMSNASVFRMEIEDKTLAVMSLGGSGVTRPGVLHVINSTGKKSIDLDGTRGFMNVYDDDGNRSLGLRSNAFDGKTAGLWIGANKSDSIGSGSTVNPLAGYLCIRDNTGNDSIVLDGRVGDMLLNNADCAEDFDISEPENIEPGTVMIIEEEGKLRQSTEAYDKKVAGVISGAGEFKPGIVLDRKSSSKNRKSVALIGKAYCKVDANSSSIRAGNLLTTSSTPGHAMKADDPLRAFGAVIGKALRPLESGKGLIPILLALQ